MQYRVHDLLVYARLNLYTAAAWRLDRSNSCHRRRKVDCAFASVQLLTCSRAMARSEPMQPHVVRLEMDGEVQCVVGVKELLQALPTLPTDALAVLAGGLCRWATTLRGSAGTSRLHPNRAGRVARAGRGELSGGVLPSDNTFFSPGGNSNEVSIGLKSK